MPTLKEAYDRFIQIDRSPKTNLNYRRILGWLVTAIGPVRDISRVTAEDVEDWFYPLVNGDKPLKRSSAAEYLSVVQRFFAFCVKRTYITTSPAEDIRVRRDEIEPKASRAIPPHELRAMLMAARFGHSHFFNLRNTAILLFLLITGCRRGGAVSLQLKNIDWPNRRALVKEKGGKWVWVRFGVEGEAALRAWLKVRPECDHDYVFTRTSKAGSAALGASGISYVIQSLSVKAQTSQKHHPHKLRHSRAHSLAWRGVPVSVTGQILNHANQSSTMRYYPHDDNAVADIINRYELAALEDIDDAGNIIPLDEEDAS